MMLAYKLGVMIGALGERDIEKEVGSFIGVCIAFVIILVISYLVAGAYFG